MKLVLKDNQESQEAVVASDGEPAVEGAVTEETAQQLLDNTMGFSDLEQSSETENPAELFQFTPGKETEKEEEATAQPQEQVAAQPAQQEPDAVQQQLSQMQQMLQQQAWERQQAQQMQQAQMQQVANDPAGMINEIMRQYNYQLPQEMVNRLRSEDPAEFSQTFGQLLQTVAANVHYNLQQQLTQKEQEVQNWVAQETQRKYQEMYQQQQEKDRVAKDFYGTYPELDRPELRQLVVTAAQQVLQEPGMHGASWNENVRDRVAQRVANILQRDVNSLRSTAPQTSQQPAQPYMSGGSPAAAQTRRTYDPNGPDAIAAIFS
jgi:hypothetical protein